MIYDINYNNTSLKIEHSNSGLSSVTCEDNIIDLLSDETQQDLEKIARSLELRLRASFVKQEVANFIEREFIDENPEEYGEATIKANRLIRSIIDSILSDRLDILKVLERRS